MDYIVTSQISAYVFFRGLILKWLVYAEFRSKRRARYSHREYNDCAVDIKYGLSPRARRSCQCAYAVSVLVLVMRFFDEVNICGRLLRRPTWEVTVVLILVPGAGNIRIED